MKELSTTDALTPTERLRLLKDQMHKYKLTIEEILENFEKESPKIIKENLNLILSLLSNCKSHIDIKINQNKHKKLKIKKVKKTKTKSNIKIEDKNKEFEEKSVKINYECDKEKSATENCDIDEIKDDIDEIKDDIEENKTAENLDDPLFQHEVDTEMTEPVDIEALKNEIIEENIDTEDNTLENLQTNIEKFAKVYSCDICNRKWQSIETMMQHKKTFDHESLKCQDCDRYFPYPKDLKRHVLKHSNEKPWCCDLCGKTFRSDWNVKFHKERVHGDKTKDIPCKLCDKTFAFEDLLKAHIRNMHHAEKSWACEQCGKTFKLKQALLRHLVTHTDERPFKCDACQKLFKSARDLTAHERSHSRVKLYECEECQVSLTHQSSMVRHYRTVHKMVKTVKTKQPVLSASVPDNSIS